MSARYFIENGDTISEPMSLDWDGGRVSFLFFDGAGDPATITGTPLVYITLYASGDLWKEVMLLSAGEWLFNGLTSRVKVDLSGVAGFVTYRVVVSRSDDPLPMIPDGAFTGLRAITTQPYTEANVKNGLEFYLRASWSIVGGTEIPAHGPIPAGETRKVHFLTTSKDIIIKLRDFAYAAEELTLALYKDPTGVSGGVPLVISNYNEVNPVATTVSASRDVVTVSDGTEFGGGDREVFFGANAVAQRTGTSIPFGRERILPAGGEYIVAITNTGTGSARVQYLLDWYEGGTDLPIPAQ
ncbi:MAG: hypothetical protein K5804_17685 [Microbacterium sp.]|uniref:hypothetical protein n=1 Tax=Microbacterium sp. TaxID=51671 RepID=UPI002613BEED|nr:hypothetical protein [Microbacterium sp.]MCV0420076.1 hypothetical protein [Microbacterium sp.]